MTVMPLSAGIANGQIPEYTGLSKPGILSVKFESIDGR
jgi:hypothetical protein